ncbi:hypothetical protein E2C01_008870 [Portunus trituberculatus]|uniref:Uncharacterized protein n=1 Tax=Portunus trituberculatus TaxID=210409 RepID=A0A5B7D360_PORTR|nr:hypothetical protein [Portunus trituberculatus]
MAAGFMQLPWLQYYLCSSVIPTLMVASSPAVTKVASSLEAVTVVMGLLEAGRSASNTPSCLSHTITDPSLPTVTTSPLPSTCPPRNTVWAVRRYTRSSSLKATRDSKGCRNHHRCMTGPESPWAPGRGESLPLGAPSVRPP